MQGIVTFPMVPNRSPNYQTKSLRNSTFGCLPFIREEASQRKNQSWGLGFSGSKKRLYRVAYRGYIGFISNAKTLLLINPADVSRWAAACCSLCPRGVRDRLRGMAPFPPYEDKWVAVEELKLSYHNGYL